jgi:dihydroorotase
VDRRLLVGGQVIDPVRGRVRRADVLVADGRIADVGLRLERTSAEVIDCRGRHLAPGFVDLHCHLREPGREDEETLASGTTAALAGGFTHVCPMPNTEPAIDTEALVRFVTRRAEEAGGARVHPVGCCTKARQGKELAEIGGMRQAGAVAVSDDGNWVADAMVMRRVLEYAKTFDLPVLSHCEVPELGRGVAREGTAATRLGLGSVPWVAEAAAVARDVMLAELTGGRLHVCHVSCAATVEVLRWAKARGVPVTAETCPHYFCLGDEALTAFDSALRVNPPLGTEADRRAILAGLRDGTIDAIATDHAPHTREEKETEFDAAAPGIIGFQTAFSLGYEALVLADVLSLTDYVARLSTVPAQILGLALPRIEPDHEADFVLLDLRARWEFTPPLNFSLSRNSPFFGRPLRGRVTAAVLGDDLRVFPYEREKGTAD